MKKWLIALLGLACLMLLCACGQEGAPAADSATPATLPESVTPSGLPTEEPTAPPANVPADFDGPLELALAVQEEYETNVANWYAGMGEDEKKIIRRAIKGLEGQSIIPQFSGFEVPTERAFSIAILVDLPYLYEWPVFVEDIQPNAQEFLSLDETDALKGYRLALESRVDNTLTRLLDEQENLPLREAEILLDVRRSGDDWAVSMRPSAMIDITESVRQDLKEKTDFCFNISDYQTIYAAQALREHIAELPFPARLEEIIHNIDEKYSLTISHPDAEAVYAQAADRAIARIREEYADGLYGRFTDDYLHDIIGEEARGVEDVEEARTTMIVHFTGEEAKWEAESSPEFLRFVLEYEDGLSAVIPYVRERVADLSRGEAEKPEESGVISGERAGERFRVYIPEGEEDYYVRVYRLEENALDGPSSYQQGAYIRQGGSLSSRLPEGRYLVKIARGSAWYGEEAVFGQFGSYARIEKIIEIYDGHSFTLHLDEAEDAAALSAISYADFRSGPAVPAPEEE